MLAVELDRKRGRPAQPAAKRRGQRARALLASADFCRVLARTLAAQQKAAPTAALVAAGGAGGGRPTRWRCGCARRAASCAPRWSTRRYAGLDAQTLRLAGFEHVLYISCNLVALLRDLEEGGLGRTHELCRFAVFDHFLYGPHLEVAVHLRRRVPGGRRDVMQYCSFREGTLLSSLYSQRASQRQHYQLTTSH